MPLWREGPLQDVIDFQIEPVLRDQEAGPILKEMM
jgi:hypothetical protein